MDKTTKVSIFGVSIGIIVIVMGAYFLGPFTEDAVSEIIGVSRYDWQKAQRIPISVVKRVDKGLYGFWSRTKEVSPGYFYEFVVSIRNGQKELAYKAIDDFHNNHVNDKRPILYAENEKEIVVWFVCYNP